MSAYQDLINHVSAARFSDKFVAFADILGYKEAVKAANELVDLSIDTIIMTRYKEAADKYNDIDVGMFSDAISVWGNDLNKK